MIFGSQKTEKGVVEYTSHCLVQENGISHTKCSGMQNKAKKTVKDGLNIVYDFWDGKMVKESLNTRYNFWNGKMVKESLNTVYNFWDEKTVKDG